jgi:outer membrane receptor protein involved in Fe transport
MERANASIIYQDNEDWDFHLNAGMSDGSLELFQQPGLPRGKWDVRGHNLHALLNYSFNDLTTMQLNGYKNSFKYQAALVPSRSQQELLTSDQNGFFFPVRDQEAMFSGSINTIDYSVQLVGKAFDEQMAWVVGAERREVENTGGIVKDSERDISSLFGNFTYRFGDGWIAGFAIRKDKDSITGGDIGYNASLPYALNETDSLRMTSSKAFRAPSLFELFSSIDLPVPNQNQQVNFRGNTNLEVETIESIDITYSAQFGENLQASLIWLPMENLKIYGSYRWISPKDLNSVAGETFFTPEQTFKVGANWTFFEDFSIDMLYQQIGKTDESEFVRGDVSPDGHNFTKANQMAYNNLNVSLHYRPGWWKGLDIYLVVDNALNDKHVEYYEYDQILNGVGETDARTIWGGVA